MDFNIIGSDGANSTEEEEGLSGEDQADGETGKKSDSEESNEGPEKESTDATSSAVDEKEKEKSEEKNEEKVEEKEVTMRPNTKARWGGKSSSSSQRLANPTLLAILLTCLPLIANF